MEELWQLKAQLQAENVFLREEVDRKAKHPDIVGRSAPLARVLEQVELVAHAIYQRCNLRKRLFVTVNCAALPAIPSGD
jgi:transcriptional regulator with GAF, ATPase, and Fis domain